VKGNTVVHGVPLISNFKELAIYTKEYKYAFGFFLNASRNAQIPV
jgi:hypothetical protein